MCCLVLQGRNYTISPRFLLIVSRRWLCNFFNVLNTSQRCYWDYFSTIVMPQSTSCVPLITRSIINLFDKLVKNWFSLILTIIPVLTFAKCRVFRIPFHAFTNVASRCISASCIFMTVTTNATLVQIYTGNVDKELKLNFFFALIYAFCFLFNCERAEAHGFLKYYWLRE